MAKVDPVLWGIKRCLFSPLAVWNMTCLLSLKHEGICRSTYIHFNLVLSIDNLLWFKQVSLELSHFINLSGFSKYQHLFYKTISQSTEIGEKHASQEIPWKYSELLKRKGPVKCKKVREFNTCTNTGIKWHEGHRKGLD